MNVRASSLSAEDLDPKMCWSCRVVYKHHPGKKKRNCKCSCGDIKVIAVARIGQQRRRFGRRR